MDLEPLDTSSIRRSPPEVEVLLDDLFQTTRALGQDLDLLADLIRQPDHRFANMARWRTLISQLCVLDALLIDAIRHAKRCCTLYQPGSAASKPR